MQTAGQHRVLVAILAVATLAELEALATLIPTSLVRATASFCSGAVECGQGDLEAAKRRFEDSVDLYTRAGVPYEAARARIELATVLAATRRPAAAAEQAARAHEVLMRLGAVHEAERATPLLGLLDHDASGPQDRTTLTTRERQVLALVAQGMSDAAIAASLALSRHTVHRHVANIFTKLGCSSRAAAVAIAAAQGLLDVPTA